MTVFLVIVVLFVLILVHEVGHFIAAKISGVKVEELGIGYPPRAWRLGKRGDTEYTINWIPFGGFVRLFGEEGAHERSLESFAGAGRLKQACILVAGVFMNMLVAWILFTIALHMGIPRSVEVPGPGVSLVISEVVQGSPADVARLRPGDLIKGMIDNRGIELADLSPASVAAFVSERGGQRIMLTSVQNGVSVESIVTPANAVIPGAGDRAGIGIGLVLVSSQPLGWIASITGAFSEMGNAFIRIAWNVFDLIKNAVLGSPDFASIIGPVGLVSVVGDAAETGFAHMLALAAFISVNLAVINLIPIPALDGGRLAILGVESILRRPAPKLAIYILNLVGIGAILLLMVVVTFQDIARLLV